MSVSQTHIGSTKNVNLLAFGTVNLGNASGTLQVAGATTGNATTEWIAPYAGSVLGFSGRLNAALTTGTLAMYATKNGTALTAFSGQTTSAHHVTAQTARHTQEGRKSGYTFVAGDRLGMGFTASDTIAPTGTVDGAWLLIVLFEGVQY